MGKMTIAERKKNHRKMWLWLAKTGEDKCYWPEWKFNGGKIPAQIHDCFLCKIYDYDAVHDFDCHCPVKWSAIQLERVACQNGDSPYEKWFHSQNLKERKRLAKKIAGMWK